MSKKNIEKNIPQAIIELQKEFGDVIPSSYNGYISSFGASIIQSGLKPTLALFENKDAKTEEKKYKLSSIILKILAPSYKGDSLLKYTIENEKKEGEVYLKNQILDIAVAVKLSIRTFKLEKGKKDE